MAPRPSVWGPLGWVVVDIGMERVCFGPPAQPPVCNEHRAPDAPKVQNNEDRDDRVRELWTGRPQPRGPGSVGHGPRSEGWRSVPSCLSTPAPSSDICPRQGRSQSPCEALSRPLRHLSPPGPLYPIVQRPEPASLFTQPPAKKRAPRGAPVTILAPCRRVW